MSKIEVNEISKTSTANEITFSSPVTINDTVTMGSPLKIKSYQTSELSGLTPSTGEIIFDTDVSKLKVYTGSAWEEVGTTLDLSALDQSIIPDTDVTYDLGSTTYKFRDLYLSGNSINLGSQTITSDATGVTISGGLKPASYTTANREAISNPTNGMQVYDTDENEMYIYRSNEWRKVKSTPNNYTISYLIVGGGGAGGFDQGGGGGGGGVLDSTGSVTPGNSYTVSVGNGGTATGNGGTKGGNGGDSSLVVDEGTMIASGGGGGGSINSSPGATGGSGGGGSSSWTGGNRAAGTGTTGQGNNGGTGGSESGGGGGGAGGAGGNTSGTNGGAGGAGYTSTITGSSITYAGGGGGGSYRGTHGSGGSGGGGRGMSGSCQTTPSASSGTVNLGGGGGGSPGCGNSTTPSGAGGKGIVIVSFPTTISYQLSAGTQRTITTVGSNTVIQFTDGSGTITFS